MAQDSAGSVGDLVPAVEGLVVVVLCLHIGISESSNTKSRDAQEEILLTSLHHQIAVFQEQETRPQDLALLAGCPPRPLM